MTVFFFFSDNALSRLNEEVNELRQIMEVFLDSNRFTQPSPSQQTGARSDTSGNCMQYLPKIGPSYISVKIIVLLYKFIYLTCYLLNKLRLCFTFE